MTEHEHDFEPARLLPVFGGKATAWVPVRALRHPYSPATPVEPTPGAWLCACGEQGYEVPA